jgi:hypothetical protein
MKEATEMSKARWALGVLQVMIGLAAIPAGLAFIIDPSGAALGIPQELLASSPFHDFSIPGFVLMVVNGFGSIAGGVLTFTRHPRAGLAAVALGGFLMLWIVAQTIWLSSVSWLHTTYLALGVLEVALGAGIDARRPTDEPPPPTLKDIAPIM